MDKKYILTKILLYLSVFSAGILLATYATEQTSRFLTWETQGIIDVICFAIIFLCVADYRVAILGRVDEVAALWLFLAFFCAFSINAQAFFVTIVLFATSFLYRVKPLQLERFSFVSNIILAIDLSVLFFLGWLLLYGSLGFLPQLLFPLMYFLVLFVQSCHQLIVVWRKKPKLYLLTKTLLVFFLLLSFIMGYYFFCYKINIIVHEQVQLMSGVRS